MKPEELNRVAKVWFLRLHTDYLYSHTLIINTEIIPWSTPIYFLGSFYLLNLYELTIIWLKSKINAVRHAITKNKYINELNLSLDGDYHRYTLIKSIEQKAPAFIWKTCSTNYSIKHIRGHQDDGKKTRRSRYED